MARPTTIGALKESGWQSRSVKDELRENLIQRIQSGSKLFEGIVGYDRTVLPQVINAVLARHNLILLGLRGQAKTRILRSLVELLDEYIPIVRDSEINDDPYEPTSKRARDLVAMHGDDPRSSGCTENPATPRSWPRRTSASLI